MFRLDVTNFVKKHSATAIFFGGGVHTVRITREVLISRGEKGITEDVEEKKEKGRGETRKGGGEKKKKVAAR